MERNVHGHSTREQFGIQQQRNKLCVMKNKKTSLVGVLVTECGGVATRKAGEHAGVAAHLKKTSPSRRRRSPGHT